jgi:hypothetical protein
VVARPQAAAPAKQKSVSKCRWTGCLWSENSAHFVTTGSCQQSNHFFVPIQVKIVSAIFYNLVV